MVLCISIWASEDYFASVLDIKKFSNLYTIHLCMFFTSLVLHFGVIATIRNGIQMARFVIFHSEEFKHPNFAFALGVLIVVTNMIVALTNIFYLFE